MTVLGIIAAIAFVLVSILTIWKLWLMERRDAAIWDTVHRGVLFSVTHSRRPAVTGCVPFGLIFVPVALQDSPETTLIFTDGTKYVVAGTLDDQLRHLAVCLSRNRLGLHRLERI